MKLRLNNDCDQLVRRSWLEWFSNLKIPRGMFDGNNKKKNKKKMALCTPCTVPTLQLLRLVPPERVARSSDWSQTKPLSTGRISTSRSQSRTASCCGRRFFLSSSGTQRFSVLSCWYATYCSDVWWRRRPYWERRLKPALASCWQPIPFISQC